MAMGVCDECSAYRWLYHGLCGYCNEPELRHESEDDIPGQEDQDDADEDLDAESDFAEEEEDDD